MASIKSRPSRLRSLPSYMANPLVTARNKICRFTKKHFNNRSDERRDIDCEKLRCLLVKLPQELYDEIYDLTFTNNHEFIHITNSWRPPKLLQIDRSSRSRFAARFFNSNTFFVFGAGQQNVRNIVRLTAKWLASQDPKYLLALQNLRVGFTCKVANCVYTLWSCRLLLTLALYQALGKHCNLTHDHPAWDAIAAIQHLLTSPLQIHINNRPKLEMRKKRAASLKSRLASLPQELCDEIYDLTFSPKSEDSIITEYWRPSHLLRVDYASRQKYLRRYFQPNTTFIFRSFNFLNFDEHLVSWLARRNAANLAPTQKIVLVLEGPIRDAARHTRMEHTCRARTLMGMAGTHRFVVDHPAKEMVENMKLKLEKPKSLWDIAEAARWRKANAGKLGVRHL